MHNSQRIVLEISVRMVLNLLPCPLIIIIPLHTNQLPPSYPILLRPWAMRKSRMHPAQGTARKGQFSWRSFRGFWLIASPRHSGEQRIAWQRTTVAFSRKRKIQNGTGSRLSRVPNLANHECRKVPTYLSSISNDELRNPKLILT